MLHPKLINYKDRNISKMNKRIIRLSESELQGIMHKCVEKALKHKLAMNESVDWDREVKQAHKTLMKMSPLLTDLGLRLEGTKFRPLYQDVRDSLITLNDAIIKYLKEGGK